MASVLPQSAPPSALTGYPMDARGDIFAGAAADVAAKWHRVADALLALGDGQLDQADARLARELEDLGTTFRPAGDKDERAWPLGPMPLLIGTAEWEALSRGLVQRASLLESVIADIYGEQQLVADGHLPAAVITGSPHFARKMQGVAPVKGRYLHVCAVDLARGPDGEWRVLADRLRLPTGIGYALENRLAISRTTGTLLSDINARRLAEFFLALRNGIAADCQRDEPRIALLTPGPFNQSYAEQAHIARYLGIPLVEGRDLTVSRERLYVRTIAGPKRIDALWRWIDSHMLDPLAFDAHSQIGVPDLFEAWAAGDLTVVNWPGVGVLEARAFSAFLPRLAKVLLGESLILPNMATWWCGGSEARATVAGRFDELVVSSAFGGSVAGLKDGRTRAGASLDAEERAVLLAAMEQRPMDYVGQEIVRLSTTPALVGNGFEPRPFTMRVFLARGGDGAWSVMPGGFARLSRSGELRTSLIGKGDFSADVCIVDEVAVQQHNLLGPGKVPPIRRRGGILSSQAADNLFWFGRYGERAEITVRVVRSLLGSSIEVDGGSRRGAASLARLVELLVRWGAVDAEHADLPLPKLCARVFRERELFGGVERLCDSLRAIGRNLRDRMANNVWRIANQPVPPIDHKQAQSIQSVADEMIDRFSALAGLATENMARSPAWRFLDLGRRIERALNICRIARPLLGQNCGHDDFGLLLDLCDSQITYRARYLASPLRDPVTDLVLLDPDNPRGLIFQIERIEEHLDALPQLTEGGAPDAPLRQISAILAVMRSLEAADIDDSSLRDIETRLLSLSDAIAQRFFLQYEKSENAGHDRLLA